MGNAKPAVITHDHSKSQTVRCNPDHLDQVMKKYGLTSKTEAVNLALGEALGWHGRDAVLPELNKKINQAMTADMLALIRLRRPEIPADEIVIHVKSSGMPHAVPAVHYVDWVIQFRDLHGDELLAEIPFCSLYAGGVVREEKL